MKVTIIADDNMVIIDGRALEVPLTDFPIGIHAVQWNGDIGHIERQGLGNEHITAIEQFNPWIEKWKALAFDIDNKIPEPQPELPISLTPWQIRKACNYLGIRAQVEEAVLNSSDQDIKDGWNHAEEFIEDFPFVVNMFNALGKSDEERHAFFVLGKTL